MSNPTPSPSLVSVVVCFRDAGPFLAEAIESVRSQTHERWEAILVDDGSADASTQIARAAALADPSRIRYVDHPGHANRGKASSRNVGLRLAQGELVVFLDADDVLLPHKLAHQAAILDGDARRDAVYGRTWYWYPDRTAGGGRRDHPSRLWLRAPALYDPPALLVRFLTQPDAVPCLCALMARRRVLLALGGFEESIQHLYEDQVLLAKLAISCRVHVDPRCGERYRQHEGSSSSRAMREGLYHPWRPHPARRVFLEWLAARLAVEEPAVRAATLPALRRAWRPYRFPRAGRLLAPPAYAWKSVRARVALGR
jgi:glycosyltransferase involved in cell wall biosynthesis